MTAHVRLTSLLWTRLLPAAGVITLIIQLTVWLPRRAHADGRTDVDVYYAAVQHAAASEQVYGRQARVHADDVPSDFYYPPSALALLEPAHRLDETSFRYLCFGIALTGLWALAFALAKLATGDLRDGLAVGVLLSIFPPVVMNMNVGNLDMVVIALTAWAFAAPRFAAVLLVIASAIKVYPAFALMAWYPRADWRFRRSTCLAAVIVGGLTILGGFHYVHEWLALGLPSASVPSTHYGNWSLSMILVYSGVRDDLASTPLAVRFALSVVPLIAAVVAALATRKKPIAHAAAAALIAGTWFTAFCWWWRILPLLTIPAAVWYRSARCFVDRCNPTTKKEPITCVD